MAKWTVYRDNVFVASIEADNEYEAARTVAFRYGFVSIGQRMTAPEAPSQIFQFLRGHAPRKLLLTVVEEGE